MVTNIKNPSNFSTIALWNSSIRETLNEGHAQKALLLFRRMIQNGMKPNNLTFPFAAKACAKLSNLKYSQLLHAQVAKSWFQSNIFVQTAMVDMYIKCGRFGDAHNVFVKMPVRDTASWNAMLVGFAQMKGPEDVFSLLRDMRFSDTQPDPVTVLALLHSVMSIKDVKSVHAMHSFGIRSGISRDVSVSNTLIAAYAKCGDLNSAESVFKGIDTGLRSLVSWNSMIAAYADFKKYIDSLSCYKNLLRSGLSPDISTIISLLSSFVQPEALFPGLLVHSHGIHLGCDSNTCVVNTLVSMYSKCGDIDFARLLFDSMSERTCVSWTAMISGYAQKGDISKALALFNAMQEVGEKPDLVTVLSLISGCGQTGALDLGRWINSYSNMRGLKDNVMICNALLDMYAKCGSINDTRELFYSMPERTIVSWTTMITACALNGDTDEALDLFVLMVESGTKPNHITFIGVLQACIHGGLLEKGLECFHMMTERYGLNPKIDHYSCMVDLLGRKGQIKEALKLIESMPLKPDTGIWSALLCACKLHHDTETGKYVSQRLFELEPHIAVPYVEMANMYASAGMWDGVAEIRTKMKCLQVRKYPGQSILQLNEKSHVFTVDDREHLESLYIYDMLDGLTFHSKQKLLAHSETIYEHE